MNIPLNPTRLEARTLHKINDLHCPSLLVYVCPADDLEPLNRHRNTLAVEGFAFTKVCVQGGLEASDIGMSGSQQGLGCDNPKGSV